MKGKLLVAFVGLVFLAACTGAETDPCSDTEVIKFLEQELGIQHVKIITKECGTCTPFGDAKQLQRLVVGLEDEQDVYSFFTANNCPRRGHGMSRFCISGQANSGYQAMKRRVCQGLEDYGGEYVQQCLDGTYETLQGDNDVLALEKHYAGTLNVNVPLGYNFTGVKPMESWGCF